MKLTTEDITAINNILKNAGFLSLEDMKHKVVHTYREKFDCPSLSLYIRDPFSFRQSGKSTTIAAFAAHLVEHSYDVVILVADTQAKDRMIDILKRLWDRNPALFKKYVPDKKFCFWGQGTWPGTVQIDVSEQTDYHFLVDGQDHPENRIYLNDL